MVIITTIFAYLIVLILVAPIVIAILAGTAVFLLTLIGLVVGPVIAAIDAARK